MLEVAALRNVQEILTRAYLTALLVDLTLADSEV